MEKEFELKHRLVGAAVLIFFGVLVLPWWLSPPAPQESLQSKTSLSGDTILDQAVTQDPDSLESDLLAALAAEQGILEIDEESVYVSRIIAVDEQDQILERETSTRNGDPESNSSTSQTNQIVSAPAAASQSRDQSSTPKVTPQPNTQSASETKRETVIELGWAVQVGVYTDSKGAVKVVDDLKRNGFKPQTTIVETNKGSGTRVWLGPFEARVDAAKAKTNLTSKTGEPGFIRRFP